MNNAIPFNKPFLTGNETAYIQQAVAAGKISGDGIFTEKCHRFFKERFGFRQVLLTTSGTDALEMAAILIGIQPGDEVIMPSYTFVSTANAFVLRGAHIVFADSNEQNPTIDANSIEKLITIKTKAIVPVHYAGIACDMDAIMALAGKYNLFVVEDAAQAIDSYYTGEDGRRRVLGSIGHLAAFSFHETKNVIAGEGGMLAINDDRLAARAEIIREKGTNRSAFFRGETAKYEWIDIGSSFLPSEIIAAFLFAQLENLPQIQQKRIAISTAYRQGLAAQASANKFRLPYIPEYATNNGSMFYLVCQNLQQRDALIACCVDKNIHPVFHYLPLHSSPFYAARHDGRVLANADRYAGTLLRLPFYFDLAAGDIQRVIDAVTDCCG
jgi:dTDP-4-amino-4,6-dideoxygalactose transaminase